MPQRNSPPTAIELCAGGGGQAIGLHAAGFSSLALVEWNPVACETLLTNRPSWPVWNGNVRTFDASVFVDQEPTLVAGGVPCQPFTIAGGQFGSDDQRDLFPEAIRIVRECMPRAFMFENVAPLAGPRFAAYRNEIMKALSDLGYYVEGGLVNAAHFGVPQDRRRFVLVGRHNGPALFPWPIRRDMFITVGAALEDLMSSRSWPGTKKWATQANRVAPTIVGGSEKHGGPDLGPTRARREWASMRVDGLGIANEPPDADFPEDGSPRLTLRMAARLQGFPDSWKFAGSKTNAYRQVGNAFPPPVAEALATAVLEWLDRPADLSAIEPRQLALTAGAP